MYIVYKVVCTFNVSHSRSVKSDAATGRTNCISSTLPGKLFPFILLNKGGTTASTTAPENVAPKQMSCTCMEDIQRNKTNYKAIPGVMYSSVMIISCTISRGLEGFTGPCVARGPINPSHQQQDGSQDLSISWYGEASRAHPRTVV